MKELNHLQTFESFDYEDIENINEGFGLDEALKAKIRAYCDKNLATLKSALAPFRGKSEQEVQGMLSQNATNNEGLGDTWNKVRSFASKFFNLSAMGVASVSFISALIGLVQLGVGGEGTPVPTTMSGGMTGLVAALFIYAISYVFKPSAQTAQ